MTSGTTKQRNTPAKAALIDDDDTEETIPKQRKTKIEKTEQNEQHEPIPEQKIIKKEVVPTAQQIFKQKVIEAYKGLCAVTQSSLKLTLETSQIRKDVDTKSPAE